MYRPRPEEGQMDAFLGTLGLMLFVLGFFGIFRSQRHGSSNRNLMHLSRMGHPCWITVYAGVICLVLGIALGYEAGEFWPIDY